MTVRRRLMGIKPTTGGTDSVLGRARRRRATPGEVIPATDLTPLPYRDGEVLSASLSRPTNQLYRHGDYVHVSDLIGKCLRRVALSSEFAMPIPAENLWPSTRLTFAQGHAIAEVVTTDAIENNPDRVYSNWTCECKDTTSTGVYSSAKDNTCPKCKTKTDNHNEMTFFDEGYKIVGNCDLTLHFDGAFYITEIKSIKGDFWDTLAGPKPDHVLQALFYWWLARRNGLQLHDKLSILYASKNMMMKSPYKEFTIQPTQLLHRIDDYLEDALALKVWRETGVMPPRVECTAVNVGSAKRCHVAEPCFDEG